MSSLKLVKYTAATPSERAALIPAAIDYWNSGIHYWDRTKKHGKMMDSPYSFYCGTAQLFWFDFGQDERLQHFGSHETLTWLSGDYHAYNAGSFQQQQEVIYGLNDFDESVIADYQLDLWRLAVSVVLIARSNKNLDQEEVGEVIDALSGKYVDCMRHYCSHKSAVAESLTKKQAYGKLDEFLKIVEDNNSQTKMLDKWAPKGEDGVRRFDLSTEKLGSATAQEKQDIVDALSDYWTTLKHPMDPGNFQVLDICRRLLAGTGSLGSDRFYVLLQDGDTERILDVKQQERPAPYDHLDTKGQEIYNEHAQGNHAKAVTVATERMSLIPDPFCGWMKLANGKHYSVQERNPYRGSYPALIEEAKGKLKGLALDSKKRYVKMAEHWSWVLASHHAYARRGQSKSLEESIVGLVGSRNEAFQELVRTVPLPLNMPIRSRTTGGALLVVSALT